MRTVHITKPCTAAPFYVAASVGETVELPDELAVEVVAAGLATFEEKAAQPTKKAETADAAAKAQK